MAAAFAPRPSRLLAVFLCVVVFGGAVARIAHLRSLHRTPRNIRPICGGEAVPCAAIGSSGLPAYPNYDACWEAKQPPKRSPKFFEGMELVMLRKLDEAQCTAIVSLSKIVRGR